MFPVLFPRNMLAPAPTTVVENAVQDAFWDGTLAPSKRRRLEPLDNVLGAQVNTSWCFEPAAEPSAMCGDTIVCFGMVGRSLLDGALSTHTL